MPRDPRRLCCIVIALMGADMAQATNGTMFHGYGARSQAMGGVGIGYIQDSHVGANNPAGFGMLGDRQDIDVAVMKGDRGAVLNGRDIDSNGKDIYVFPAVGWARTLSDKVGIGFSLYTLGAGTVYREPVVTGPVTSPTRNTEAELAQLVFSPGVSYQLNENHRIGFGLSLAYQQFYVQGVEPILGNPGKDRGFGAGFNLGWHGRLTDRFSMGVSYHSKVKMEKLEKYEHLLANQGEMDIPERYGLGFAYQLSPATTLAMDYLNINYAGVKSLSNSVYAFLDPASPLGSKGGPGFGWQRQHVYKFGIAHQYDEKLILRAGYSRGSDVIPEKETALNYLAQVTPKEHFTLGASIKKDSGSEWSFAYTYSPKKTIAGSGMLSQQTDLYHQQHWIMVGYGW